VGLCKLKQGLFSRDLRVCVGSHFPCHHTSVPPLQLRGGLGLHSARAGLFIFMYILCNFYLTLVGPGNVPDREIIVFI